MLRTCLPSPTQESTTMTTPTVYQDHGHESRKAYLLALSEETGVDLETVIHLAQLLGPSEDFDGLVTALEDSDALGQEEEGEEDEDDDEEIDSDFDEEDDPGVDMMWKEW